MKDPKSLFLIAPAILFLFLAVPTAAQKPATRLNQAVRTVTIPISIFTKEELRQDQAEEFVRADNLTVIEDKDEQTILSIRSVAQTPLALAVLIQDDLGTNFNLQLADTSKFIRTLPKGSRVMVAYLRAGTIQVRQRFTDDLERAARSLRIVSGSSANAPRSPYDGVLSVLPRFEALPMGRRAILLISDGLDASGGLANTSPTDSIDLDRAILRSQRAGVAVYSIYTPASLTVNGSSRLVLNAQSSLQKMSHETGGRAFFQGSVAPVSFDPFFKDLGILLNRQFALTYLSTHMDRGYHKVEVTSSNPVVRIDHPKGYYYR